MKQIDKNKVKTSSIEAPAIFQVIFRVNFLAFVLCLVMNRPYQFYFIAPMLTFWFLLLNVIIVIPPRVSSNHKFQLHSGMALVNGKTFISGDL